MRNGIRGRQLPFAGVVVAVGVVLLMLTVQSAAAAIGVSSIAPATGPIAGDTTVTITGTDFPTNIADIEVTFGGEVAAVQTVNGAGTQITVKSPAVVAPGKVDVVVTNTDTDQSTIVQDGFTYVAGPIVSGVAPSPSAANSVVTIYGVNFAENATVKFGATSGTEVDVVSEHQIKVKVPAGTGTVDVTVTNPDTQTDTLDDAFTYGQAQGGGAPGTIVSGSIPIGGGYGLFVFGGGTNQQLLTASGCPQATASFFSTNAGAFVVYIPGTGVQAVNAAWNALYANGIPATTALIGKCV